MFDHAEASALDIARAVERGEITATAVITAALARIAAHNPVLNAIIVTEALSRPPRQWTSRQLRRRRRGGRSPPKKLPQGKQ